MLWAFQPLLLLDGTSGAEPYIPNPNMSNQGNIQAAVRLRSGSTADRTYNEDWHFLWDQEAIAPGTFNERMLAWLNVELVADGDTEAPYADLPGAKQSYAERAGFYNWSSMNALL